MMRLVMHFRSLNYIKKWSFEVKEPLVSVLIPLHNCALYVEEAIQSILQQTYQNLEVVIIDDGSTDGTGEIVNEMAKQDPRIVFKAEKNKGISKTLNQAVALSTGGYITRMDGDDLTELNRIEIQKSFLDENPHINIVGTWLKLFGERDEIFYFRQYDEFIKAMFFFRHGGFAHTTVFAKREVFDKYQYDPTYDFAEDVELWSRMVKQSNYIKFANIPQVLCHYRIHAEQVCSARRDIQDSRWRKIIYNYIKHFIPNATNKEIEIHYRIINKVTDLNETELIETGKWIQKLSKGFNVQIEDKYFCISERWYRFCKDQQSEKAMSIFSTYADSEGKLCFI